jgi:pyruvate formate lyase activating enzyme
MGRVVCELCPHGCVIPEGGAGDCRVRVNIDGRLRATTYGRPSAIHVDPMEKKPLFHFHPATAVLSIGTAGCNLHCRNCQNWQLSQRGGEEMEVTYRVSPEELAALAETESCRAVAYTYNDPVVFFEYVYDSAVAARARGLKNVLVTAGYINREPLRRLCRVIDATNTDLKGFDERFYRDNCGASLKPVLESLVAFREEGVWQEVTHLVIPGVNDDLAMIRRMVRWHRDALGSETPLHFSRFQPMYRLQNLPPTPVETLMRAREEALDVGLQYVYIGNLFGHPAESTRCPRDGTVLIRRNGMRVLDNRLTAEGRCPTCGDRIPGVWT